MRRMASENGTCVKRGINFTALARSREDERDERAALSYTRQICIRRRRLINREEYSASVYRVVCEKQDLSAR